MEVLTNLRDDALKRMVDELSELIATAESIKHEEENIRRFSEHMIYVKELLVKQQSQQPGGQFGLGSSGSLLRRMEDAVNNAREAIEEYKSKSSLVRFLFSRSVLSQLNQSSTEIAYVLSLLPFTHLNTALNIKSNVDAIIHSLKFMVLKLEANTDAIHSRLDLYISENSGNRQHTEQSLFCNPRAKVSTTSSSVSPFPPPIEAQDVQVGEPKNKACQFTQMLQCFDAMEMASPNISESANDIVNPPNMFFYCPLTLKLMEDPVNVSCNHSYERKAIEAYFRSGQKLCLLCGKEYFSSKEGVLELTPNPALLNTISEWKQRNASINAERNSKKQLRDAASRITSENMESTNRTLDELLALMMEMPSCISEATESSCKLVPKLAELLKKGVANTSSVLRCLLLIARFSDENKETIGRGGVIKCLLKQGGKNEPTAVDILLEISKNQAVAQKIKASTNSIPILVSLLDNPSSYMAEKARSMLVKLSTNINDTIMMAKSGYLPPFIDQFNSQGNSEETNAFMAEELAQMQLTETAANNLENELFIVHLTVMLSSSSPSSKLASLKCIKRLLAFNGLRTLFLSTGCTIPALLGLITDTATEPQLKQKALDILISFIEISQPLEKQSNPGFQRLYSRNSIQDLLEQIKTSTPEEQLLLLRLLLAMVQISDTTMDWIISDQKAISCLSSALSRDKCSEVRLNALKLVYYIAGNYPSGIPLPPSPAMEATLSCIISILTESCIHEEISIASNIISHLPRGIKSIDAMLQSSAVLKAIHDLMISHANKSKELLENALGALLRCINQSNYEFQMQVSKLEPAIVQMLSTGSPLAKQRAAMIISHLARCTPESSTSLSRASHFHQRSWLNPFPTHCPVHESSCSLQRVTCLVKAGAVRPLLDILDNMNPAASEAALMALDTLFDTGNLEPGASETLFNAVAAIIIENKGAAPILEVLERGPLPVKKAALELFGKIYKYPGITSKELDKFKAILVYLHNEEDELKKKAKLLFAELV